MVFLGPCRYTGTPRVFQSCLLLLVVDMQQFVGPLLADFLHQSRDNEVPLGALDEGRPVRFIQALGPLLLHGEQSVGLARAAHAAGLAGHDLHQIVISRALLNIPEQLLGVHQAMDHSDLQHPVPYRQGHLTDHITAPEAGELDGLERVFGLVLTTQATALFSNIATGSSNVAILLTASMYKDFYAERKIHAKNLSRACEDMCTMTFAIIPWTTSGVYISGALGVPALTYLPFCWFNLIGVVLAILVAISGKDIPHVQESETAETV